MSNDLSRLTAPIADRAQPHAQIGVLGGWAFPVLIAMFIVSGTVKASPALQWIPFDLTLGFGSVLLVAGLMEMLRGGRPAYLQLTLLSIVFAAGFITAPLGDYGQDKSLNLLVLTFGVAVFSASMVLSTPASRRHFLFGTILAGALVFVIYIMAPSTDAAAGRAALEGSTTIAAARAAGAALVVVFALANLGQIKLVIAAPLGLALVSLIIATGSRGPVVATAAAVGVIVIVRAGWHPLRTALMVLIAAVCLRYVWTHASDVSTERLGLLLNSNKGASVFEREFMWDRTISLITDHPLGFGWGNLSLHLSGIDRYPHNIVLEILAEAGWISGLLFMFLLVSAGLQCVRARRTDSYAIAFLGLLVYWFVNSMVSGDVNDNRGLFVVMAACWMFARPSHDEAGARKYGASFR